MNYNLAQPFYESARLHPGKLALVANDQSFTYTQLLDTVQSIAAWLSIGNEGAPERIGILASRSMEACAGILAVAWVGAAYVALNLKQPESALVDILERTGLSAVIADRTGSKMLTDAVLRAAPRKVLAIGSAAPDDASVGVTDWNDLPPVQSFDPPVARKRDDIGYVLFTSGSTGKPKGVMVPNGAVEHLLRVMNQQYPVSFADRFAETTEISFDLSVYNMFAAWNAGASLHVIPPAKAMAPGKMIREQEITVWLSVPSIAAFMKRMGLLNPGSYPSMRLSFFCGEPLLESVADAWQEACPNAVVVNMYGPTEAAVFCIGEVLRPDCAKTRDCVAIGKPFLGLSAAVVDSTGAFLANDTPGELVLGGPQLALGYFRDPGQTTSRFVTLNGERWYRTGDLCTCDDNGTFHYWGRIDNQVKILGHRVELEDIECHLREAAKSDVVAAVPWPIRDGSAAGIVAFIVPNGIPEAQIKAEMQRRVPTYMVPTRVHSLPAIPTNSSGKVNRRALLAMLESGEAR